MSAHAPTIESRIESRGATRPGPDAVLFQAMEHRIGRRRTLVV
ncbi:MAG: hypothetical protein OSA97_19130 [Nevskia sp.]|nr:hypothetical protein [Nevskia sp.]